MLKFVVAAALFACVLAGTSTFQPAYPECAVNFTLSSNENNEVYFGYVTEDMIIMEMYDLSNTSAFYYARCDMQDGEGNCWKLYSLDRPCSVSYDTPQHIRKEVIYEVFSSFEYDDSNYPVSEPCPDASQTGCSKYCEDEEYCYIVDAKNRTVSKTKNGNPVMSYTYYDTVDPFAFLDHDCDGNPLPVPVNPCAAKKNFTPKLDCATHYEVIPDEGETVNVYVYANLKAPMIRMVDSDSSQYSLIRCDLTNEEGKFYEQVTFEGCEDSYISLDEVQEAFYSFLPSIEYPDDGTYPRACDCPEGIQSECQMYCNIERTCAVTDKDGRLVAMRTPGRENYKIKYHGEDFDSTIFATTNCDNTTKVPAPTNPCGSPKTSSSTSGSGSASTASTSSTVVRPSSSSTGSVVSSAIAVVISAIAIALLL